MFQDKRSKKIVLVAHCVLNQNSKIDACAHYPGAILEAAESLLHSGAGIIQLPCPELLYLGLDREADPKADRTIESEDTRVAERMQEDKCRLLCQSLIDSVVYQVEEYIKHGFHIIGIVGINGSPTCGVEITWTDDQELAGRGIFIDMLQKALAARGIDIDMVGITARDPKLADTAIQSLFQK